jgi:hypothetical protein
MFRHDAAKTGRFESPILPPSARSTGSAEAPPVIAGVGVPRPNPARAGVVRLPLDVPADGARVVVRVYDVAGREVRRLADGRFPAGAFEIRWDGRGATGSPLGAGVYLVRVNIDEMTFGRKIILVR